MDGPAVAGEAAQKVELVDRSLSWENGFGRNPVHHTVEARKIQASAMLMRSL